MLYMLVSSINNFAAEIISIFGKCELDAQVRRCQSYYMESANPSLMFKLEIEHQVLLHLVARLPCCRCYFAIQVENAQQKILKKKKKQFFFFHFRR